MATELAPVKNKSQHRIRQEGDEPNRNRTVCPIETPSQETKVMRHKGMIERKQMSWKVYKHQKEREDNKKLVPTVEEGMREDGHGMEVVRILKIRRVKCRTQLGAWWDVPFNCHDGDWVRYTGGLGWRSSTGCHCRWRENREAKESTEFESGSTATVIDVLELKLLVSERALVKEHSTSAGCRRTSHSWRENRSRSLSLQSGWNRYNRSLQN